MNVERAFSHGGLTISKMRHSLSDKSTRAAIVLGAWCNLPGAVPQEEIIGVFRDKGKRPKGLNSSLLSVSLSSASIASTDITEVS